MALTTVPLNARKVKTKAPTTKGGGDKKRKAAKGSHGVETLKKANVNGMAKLSSFFKKEDKVPS